MRSRNRYDSLFRYYAAKWGIGDWLLLKAQAIAESNLDPNAVSPVGAVGLTQFMPLTWREWWDKVYGTRGLPQGPRTNPERSIELQAAYMAELIRVFEDADIVLAAYNWGWGRVRRHLDANGGELDYWRLPTETQRYIERVFSIREELTPCEDCSSG